MKATTRAILQTVLVNNLSISTAERRIVEALIDGEISLPCS